MIPLLLLASAVAVQSHAAPACARGAPLPPELAGWSRPVPVAAGTRAAGAPVLALGRAARLTLRPAAGVALAPPPEKPGALAGVLAFEVPAAGRYRVALGWAAWVDVVRGGRAVASAAHGHGPDCSGVRKMVDFDLAPGRYLLQLAGTGEAVLPVMVARLPAVRRAASAPSP